MFKVNNKDTRRRRSDIFIVKFEHTSQPCSSVSIVNFEQVNTGCGSLAHRPQEKRKKTFFFNYLVILSCILTLRNSQFYKNWITMKNLSAMFLLWVFS